MTSIDNVMKSKLNNYNLAKGSLVQMQRKKTCASSRCPSTSLLNPCAAATSPYGHWQTSSRRRTLSKTRNTWRPSSSQYRSAHASLHRRSAAYAAAQRRNSIKEWNLKYERLAAMVVPRSSKCARALRLWIPY